MYQSHHYREGNHYGRGCCHHREQRRHQHGKCYKQEDVAQLESYLQNLQRQIEAVENKLKDLKGEA
ncbi:hypothetical protein [Calderihabitans maritimus]|uniref:DUF5320 domain-containing protein n=1 Tax=Calderihabitans maritimus TaxID=1246530 RepID=A0A1Z5HR12_9FIRM|nr:hypothetical protein [Calderihabitans maritimus]GAW91966.1 hypothetical protein Desku_0302 [Calderihabitans maritimus]